MHVRDFKATDYEAMQELFHRQDFEYQLPDAEAFVDVQVVADESDKAIMFLAARPTVEMFLLLDQEWETPLWRLEAFRLIHEAMRSKLETKGITDAHCWLPPEIEKAFSRRLMNSFGWVKQLWPCFSRKTTPSGK
jgi:hypothetical protein